MYVEEDQLFGAPDRDTCYANYLVAGCSMKIQQFPSVKEKDREQPSLVMKKGFCTEQ